MRVVRRTALCLLAVFALAGCGVATTEKRPPSVRVAKTLAAEKPCRAREYRRLRSRTTAYAAVVLHRTAVAYRRPGGAGFARFGPRNANGAATVFGVLGAVVTQVCDPTWYRVQLPMRPNGIIGYVRAR